MSFVWTRFCEFATETINVVYNDIIILLCISKRTSCRFKFLTESDNDDDDDNNNNNKTSTSVAISRARDRL